MRRMYLVSCVACLTMATAWSFAADGAGHRPPMAVVAAPAVETSLVVRVSAFVSEQFARPTVWRSDERLACWTNGPAAVAAMRQPGEDLIVAIVDLDVEKEKTTVSLAMKKRSALVNVRPLKREGDDSPENASLYQERVERETVRAFGMLLGMQPCPAPFCVMSPHRSLDDMDRKGRGFCPPCMMRVQAAEVIPPSDR